MGLNRLRKQMCMQFEEATKPKPTPQQPSQATKSLIDDDALDIDTTPIYEPWDTIKKFKLKNKATTKVVSNNRCIYINQVLDKLEQETSHVQRRRDNITKAKRLALKPLRENEHIVINKADKGSTVVIRNKSDYI